MTIRTFYQRSARASQLASPLRTLLLEFWQAESLPFSWLEINKGRQQGSWRSSALHVVRYIASIEIPLGI
jgi:hypothetical protein